jgi:hypothetical protein
VKRLIASPNKPPRLNKSRCEDIVLMYASWHEHRKSSCRSAQIGPT